MKCEKCGEEIGEVNDYQADERGNPIHYPFCPSEAERSGVPQGCLPSANCSAGAGADAPIDSLHSSVVPREKAEPSGPELLPCPFCGGPAEERHDHSRDLVYIACAKCYCHGPHTWSREDGKDWLLVKSSWNQRAGTKGETPTALTAQRERALARND